MDSTTHTYWISIGRNIGEDRQLPESAWERFRDRTAEAVEFCGGSIVTTVLGRGAWDGIGEDAYLLLVSVPDTYVAWLRRMLAGLAREYGQDAIGMVGGGTDTLITPDLTADESDRLGALGYSSER